jgi:copper chaperone CopZ
MRRNCFQFAFKSEVIPVQVRLRIEGVSCEKCANAVIRFIKVLPGVIDVKFADKFSYALISSIEDVPVDWLQMAVEEAGYSLTGIVA